jgi:hypothetical protein
MAFYTPNDIDPVYRPIRKSLNIISNPYNDGYVQSSCKHDLYMLKCWLEDEYNKLPTFAGEEQWEQERVIEILKTE